MTVERPCGCEGHTLDHLLQPTVMALLAAGPQHGYALIEQLSESPILNGTKPDNTGVYRLLKMLEEQGMVRHEVVDSGAGPSKRVYELTEAGWKCLSQWAATLDVYQQAIAKLVAIMRNAANTDST